jgi:hypothetical protein
MIWLDLSPPPVELSLRQAERNRDHPVAKR